MAPRFHFDDEIVRRLQIEGETIPEAVCTQTRFHQLQALAVTIKSGSFTHCFFRLSAFDSSALAVVFDTCTFRDCRLVGVSGAHFVNCTMTNVRIFGTMGCRIDGGVLRRCTLDADLPIREATRHDCATLSNRRMLAERAPERVREPYDEFDFHPGYRSAGEVLEQGKVADSRIGAKRAAVRELIVARNKLPRYPRELRWSMLGRLKQARVFGLSDEARLVLRLLIGRDQHVTGLVWPTVPWLGNKANLSTTQVLRGLRELQRRGWLSAWINTVDINAIFIDHEYVQAHFPALPHTA